MEIFKYKNYDDYVEAQTGGNKRKLSWVYVQPQVIQTIAKRHGPAKAIICHGTRNGAEQKFFKDLYAQAEIIGTEISDTADQFPMTVQWDFTEPKEEWLDKFDIVYSNSVDHSIDPIKTLTTWKEQLGFSGKLYLEYAERQAVCERTDPFKATLAEIIQLLAQVGLIIEDRISTGPKHGGVVLICRKG